MNPEPSCAPGRAVFLDRDGTLNEERSYLGDPAQLVLLPGVVGALRRLQDAGFLLMIVTNQSGIGRGYYTEADMHAVNRKLLGEVIRQGVRIERIYFAPEAPDQPSRGRKPSPAFLFDAAAEFGLRLDRCYMVGDKWIDVQCGVAAGVRASLLVRTGYGARTESERAGEHQGAVIVDDLAAAADFILKDATGEG